MITLKKRYVSILIMQEMAEYRTKREQGDVSGAWRALERAHIIGQHLFIEHLASHAHMFGFALALGNWREVAGQIFRLVLVPLGWITGRLPVGNIGRSSVGAFQPMEMPDDLAALLSDDSQL